MSIEGKLTLILLLALSCAALTTVLLLEISYPLELSLLAGILLGALLGLSLGRIVTRRMLLAMQALHTGLLNFQDHDFSVSLTVGGHDEWYDLADEFNRAADRLRQQRTHIYQRELLLDSVLHNTSTAIALTDDAGRLLYGNLAARHLLADGRPLEGLTLEQIAAQQEEVGSMLSRGQSGVFSLGSGQQQQIWHMGCAVMRMNGVQHFLYQFKPLTQELTRAEIQTWKKVIRVISHELNNSLAPISSMAHCGKRLLQGKPDKSLLMRVFNTISDRSAHLNGFLQEYADFAKLPLPQRQAFQWSDMLQTLQQLQPFVIDGDLPLMPGYGDERQLAQVLLNLLKNAAEAGSDSSDIALAVHCSKRRQWLTLNDRGSGMSAETLSQALLPFYSTKKGGTGLGLALCREIIENHGGQLAISNRSDGGLQVRFWLPQAEELVTPLVQELQHEQTVVDSTTEPSSDVALGSVVLPESSVQVAALAKAPSVAADAVAAATSADVTVTAIIEAPVMPPQTVTDVDARHVDTLHKQDSDNRTLHDGHDEDVNHDVPNVSPESSDTLSPHTERHDNRSGAALRDDVMADTADHPRQSA